MQHPVHAEKTVEPALDHAALALILDGAGCVRTLSAALADALGVDAAALIGRPAAKIPGLKLPPKLNLAQETAGFRAEIAGVNGMTTVLRGQLQIMHGDADQRILILSPWFDDRYAILFEHAVDGLYRSSPDGHFL
ncbi:MAG TPA: hypothetical protein VF267_13235, partial [Gammaproteobacteria bacterium]